jgi:uncharacterized phosphatase
LAAASITTTICLVRHGETDWNLTRRYQGWVDIPLNATGLQQAEVVSQRIAREQWDAIISSPLTRARQTAQAIANALGIEEVDVDADLRERGYGEAEGLTLAEREARWAGPEWPGLEALETMRERAMAALTRVANRHVGQRVLVVCHGGLINAVLHQISGGEHGSGITVIHNTALSTLVHDADGWSIETVTDAEHLELVAS